MSEWVSWVEWCTRMRMRDEENAPPVYEERLTETRRWWRRTCRSLAVMASPLSSISRKLQRERERKRFGLCFGKEKKCALCVVWILRLFGFWFFLGLNSEDCIYTLLREKQRVCALCFIYILINFSVSGLGLGLEQCACSAARDCSSWLPRSNFEGDRLIAQIPNWIFIILSCACSS